MGAFASTYTLKGAITTLRGRCLVSRGSAMTWAEREEGGELERTVS